MIVPCLCLASTSFATIRDMPLKMLVVFVSSYEIRPAKLFNGGKGAEQRLNIFLVAKDNEENKPFILRV